ncbi:hypothetical protein ABH994_000768 [Bradyrhizobium yuanmingense]|uniref:hypothetical protein n=1 Tax=Bradyrhizobium yuanmingense TaxID=108015 RepID=UPI003516AA41
MIRKADFAATLLALLATTVSAVACRGPQFERSILLDAIPPAAEGSDVIAKVEILEVSIHEAPGLYPYRVARGRALQSIRGTADGQIVEIYAEPDSCGGGLDQRAVGRAGFVAGRFKQLVNEILFEGSWSNHQIGKF